MWCMKWAICAPNLFRTCVSLSFAFHCSATQMIIYLCAVAMVANIANGNASSQSRWNSIVWQRRGAKANSIFLRWHSVPCGAAPNATQLVQIPGEKNQKKFRTWRSIHSELGPVNEHGRLLLRWHWQRQRMQIRRKINCKYNNAWNELTEKWEKPKAISRHQVLSSPRFPFAEIHAIFSVLKFMTYKYSLHLTMAPVIHVWAQTWAMSQRRFAGYLDIRTHSHETYKNKMRNLSCSVFWRVGKAKSI